MITDRSSVRPFNFLRPRAEDSDEFRRPFVGGLENYLLTDATRDELSLPFRESTRLRESHRLTTAVVKDLRALCHDSLLSLRQYIHWRTVSNFALFPVLVVHRSSYSESKYGGRVSTLFQPARGLECGGAATTFASRACSKAAARAAALQTLRAIPTPRPSPSVPPPPLPSLMPRRCRSCRARRGDMCPARRSGPWSCRGRGRR